MSFSFLLRVLQRIKTNLFNYSTCFNRFAESNYLFVRADLESLQKKIKIDKLKVFTHVQIIGADFRSPITTRRITFKRLNCHSEEFRIFLVKSHLVRRINLVFCKLLTKNTHFLCPLTKFFQNVSTGLFGLGSHWFIRIFGNLYLENGSKISMNEHPSPLFFTS